MKNILMFKRKFILALKIVLASFFLILFFVFIPDFCNEVREPDRILAQYKIGSKIDSLPINKNDIFFQFKTDEKVYNINIVLGGYSHPKKYLEKNHKLIMIDKGDLMLYLYFDENDTLIGKEIVGS